MSGFNKQRAMALINTEHPGPWDEWMAAAIARIEELEAELAAAIRRIGSTQYRVSDQEHKQFAAHLQKVIDEGIK